MIRCSHYFNCRDSNKTVHFKFERFDTETDWDALIIGDPNASKSIQWSEDCYQDVLNANCINEEALIIHGHDVKTNIWVEAKGITDFHIFFFRTVFKKCFFLFQYRIFDILQTHFEAITFCGIMV